MKKKETLEEFVEYLKEKPRTLGYDAILAYDRFRANRLLLQEYIDRFDSGRYFEPLTFSTTITPGAQWEKVIDHLLDKPRLSFENSSIAHSRADLTMRISGGKQLTLSRGQAIKSRNLSELKRPMRSMAPPCTCGLRWTLAREQCPRPVRCRST